MTTQISPSIGHGPWTQGGPGATPGFDAQDFRRSVTGHQRGEGVSTYNSFRVSQRAAGANLSVDVNMDEMAFVRGDSVSQQHIYDVAPHASTINEVIAAADATNPRIDRVVLQVLDTTHDASGSSLAQTRVITGTPTGGATLDNLTGAGSVPSSALLLADVLVAATDTAISNSEIRDRRAFVAGVPIPLTAVDMVPLIPVGVTIGTLTLQGGAGLGVNDLEQVAVLVQVPRRISGATRMRWKYVQGSGGPLTGNYVLAMFDASGRQIVATSSTAYAGLVNTVQVRSETISATTFEPGYYYLYFAHDTTNANSAITPGAVMHAEPAGVIATGPSYPNVGLRASGGGVTVPTTLAAFTDLGTETSGLQAGVPLVALSVG